MKNKDLVIVGWLFLTLNTSDTLAMFSPQRGSPNFNNGMASGSQMGKFVPKKDSLSDQFLEAIADAKGYRANNNATNNSDEANLLNDSDPNIWLVARKNLNIVSNKRRFWRILSGDGDLTVAANRIQKDLEEAGFWPFPLGQDTSIWAWSVIASKLDDDKKLKMLKCEYNYLCGKKTDDGPRRASELKRVSDIFNEDLKIRREKAEREVRELKEKTERAEQEKARLLYLQGLPKELQKIAPQVSIMMQEMRFVDFKPVTQEEIDERRGFFLRKNEDVYSMMVPMGAFKVAKIMVPMNLYSLVMGGRPVIQHATEHELRVIASWEIFPKLPATFVTLAQIQNFTEKLSKIMGIKYVIGDNSHEEHYHTGRSADGKLWMWNNWKFEKVEEAGKRIWKPIIMHPNGMHYFHSCNPKHPLQVDEPAEGFDVSAFTDDNGLIHTDGNVLSMSDSGQLFGGSYLKRNFHLGNDYYEDNGCFDNNKAVDIGFRLIIRSEDPENAHLFNN